MSDFIKSRPTLFCVLLYLTVFAISCTYPVTDGDFFWHVKSGQWIWQNKALPVVDHFTFSNQFTTNNSPEVNRYIEVTLKQNWLAQLALFSIWNLLGDGGVVWLRTAVYVFIIISIYWFLQQTKQGLVPFVTILLIGSTIIGYPAERPQLFGYLFIVLLLYLLERINSSPDKLKTTDSVLLIFLLMIWSNCHGSFIVGVGIISVYLLCCLIEFFCKKTAINIKLCGLYITAIVASAINPNGYKAFYIGFGGLGENVRFNVEYLSPLQLPVAIQYKLLPYWILLFLSLFLIIIKYKSVRIHHIMVIVMMALLSLKGNRYIPLFMCTAPLSAMYAPDFKLAGKYVVVPCAMLLFWLASLDSINFLKFRASREFPSKAAEFIASKPVSGNIFNYELWGGYLMVYTPHKVFVDGRGFVSDFSKIHDLALSGSDWKTYFSKLNINTIIIPGTDPYSNRVYPLVIQLSADNEWSLVFQDDVALVFMKNIDQNHTIINLHQIPKSNIEHHIIGRLNWQLKNDY